MLFIQYNENQHYPLSVNLSIISGVCYISMCYVLLYSDNLYCRSCNYNCILSYFNFLQGSNVLFQLRNILVYKYRTILENMNYSMMAGWQYAFSLSNRLCDTCFLLKFLAQHIKFNQKSISCLLFYFKKWAKNAYNNNDLCVCFCK